MTDRPTPDQIANSLATSLAITNPTLHPNHLERLEWLSLHLRSGAVIVHPDDVPLSPSPSSAAVGWNNCRRHIFGDDS